MKSEITKGIIYSEDTPLSDSLQHSYYFLFGVYNDQVSNKEQLIKTIRKIGGYTIRAMNGEIVNLFDEDDIKTKENGIITTVSLVGYEYFLNKKVIDVLERNGAIEKRAEVMKKFEKVASDEEGLMKLLEQLEKEYNCNEWEAYNYANGIGFCGGPKPDFRELFRGRMPQIAKETGLMHLSFLPVYDKQKPLEENITLFLTLQRENKSVKPKMLFINRGYVPLEDAATSMSMFQ